MNKRLLTFLLGMLVCLFTQGQREIVLNATGYGFATGQYTVHNIAENMHAYLNKFAQLPVGSRPTAVRFHVTWYEYEPSPGNYKSAELVDAIGELKRMNPNWKIALHFPYQVHYTNGPIDESEKARVKYPADPSKEALTANPSIFSTTMRNRFYAFVHNALTSLNAAGLGDLLYVEMGSGEAEEYALPYFREKNSQGQHTGNIFYSGFEGRALEAWRQQYLPCRYPGQSTVTWDGVTYNIADESGLAPDQNWNSEKGRELHRFLAWGLLDHYKNFRNTVKSVNSNYKVIYFISDFGSHQGNTRFMHNATLPMALQEFDGIYHSDGVNAHDSWRKIMPIDVIKGTNPSKIAAIEFDQEDLGQEESPYNQYDPKHINTQMVEEWFARAFKHGVNHIHLAMSFNDTQISQIQPILANLRAVYIDNPYTPPSRTSSPIVSQIYDQVFTSNQLFATEWNNANGGQWWTSDNSPVSIEMRDDGYWQNVWSCSPPSTCDYNLSLSGPSGSVQPSSTINLTSSCSGSSCSGLTYSWSGNGISGSGSSISLQAPSTAGTYTYTITATKSGCSKSASINVTVGSAPPSGSCALNKVRLIYRTASDPHGYRMQGAKFQGSNDGSTWTDLYTINTDGTGSWQEFTFSNTTPYSKIRYVSGPSGWGELTEIEFYSGTTLLTGNTSGQHDQWANGIDGNQATTWYSPTQGTSNYLQMDITNCTSCSTPPAAPVLSASSATITSGGSSTLSASNCSGTLNWSHGLSGTSPTVSPTTTTTYTATCTVNGCTSAEASVTVTVESTPPSSSCALNKVRLIYRTASDPHGYRMQGAKFQGSNDGSTWTDLYTINTDGTGSWQEFTFSNTTPYSKIRYVSGPSGWGELTEIEFYSGTTLLTGNTSGQHDQWANGIDGNQATTWYSPTQGTSNYLQMDIMNCTSCSTPPAAPVLSASSATITSGGSSTLSASNCSGTLNWSHGLSGTSPTVSPTTTTTYTATCTVNGCTSAEASVTVTVNSTGSNCETLEGHFDGANCNSLSGWVYDYSSPNATVYVDIYEGNTLIQGNIAANMFRQDLLNAGKGNGNHGFQINLPAALNDGQSHTITARVSGCTYSLNNSPKTISGCSGSSVVLDPVNPDESAGLRQLQVRPNPSTGQFITRFYLEKGKQGTISVIDMFGRVIYRKVLVGQGQHQERINLHNKANGTLLLQLQTNKGSKTQKIQIIR